MIHTETCDLLELVNGRRCQSAQRETRLMPAIRAMRSSSAGHTYRNDTETSIGRNRRDGLRPMQPARPGRSRPERLERQRLSCPRRAPAGKSAL